MGVLLPSGETQNYISVQKERSRLRDRSQFIGHSWRSDPQDISERVPAVKDERVDQKRCGSESEDA